MSSSVHVRWPHTSEPGDEKLRALGVLTRLPTTSWDGIPFTAEELEQGLYARVAKVAAQYPDSIALRHRQSQMSYGELIAFADAFADGLRNSRVRLEKPIALTTTDPVTHIVAMLGILRAGGWFAPIPKDCTPERARQIADACSPNPVILTAPSDDEVFTSGVQFEQVLHVPRKLKRLLRQKSQSPLMYLMATSGSTGQPKLVVQTQRNLLHNMGWQAEALALSRHDVFSLLHPLGNMAAMRPLMNALCNGASLCIADLDEVLSFGITTWLEQNGVTVFHLPASAFRLLERVDTAEFDERKIRIVVLGGEAVLPKDIELFGSIFRSAHLLLGLGATETCTTRYMIVPPGCVPLTPEKKVPLGFATNAKILLSPRAVGGEPARMIYESPFVTPGYWPLTKKTLTELKSPRERVFESEDQGVFDGGGILVHAGRLDSVTKIRGHKVDLVAVQSYLRGMSGVMDAHVLQLTSETGHPYLGAVVVQTDETSVTHYRIKYLLNRRFSRVEIPQSIVIVDDLPRTATAKADVVEMKKLLEVSGRSLRKFFATLSLDEQRLFGCLSSTSFPFMSRAFKARDLAPHWLDTKLSELDIDSLSRAEVLVNLERAFGVRLTPEMFDEWETLLDIADFVGVN